VVLTQMQIHSCSGYLKHILVAYVFPQYFLLIGWFKP